MEVMVDGKSDFSLKGDSGDVLSAVVAVSEFLQEKGRAILVVKTDGRSVPPEDLVVSLKGRPREDVKKLEVESEELTKLVSESLQDLSETLPELPKVCHELSAVFEGNAPQETLGPFQRLAEIWRKVKSRESMIANALGLRLDQLQLEGRSVAGLHEELNGFLKEAAGALECGDLALLGDLLEYELVPRAEVEVEVAALLRERSQGQTG